MKNISIFANVVLFEAEGLTYQAIRKNGYWDMAAMDQMRVLEMHDIQLPQFATTKDLLTMWWRAQKSAGTFSVR